MSSPPSPSLSAASSRSGSPPALDPSTLALLDSFFAQKADEAHRFNNLSARLAQSTDDSNHSSDDETAAKESTMMSVDEYRLAFGEDWQLSQFWYSTAFAMRFARALHALADPETTVAFLCCPTAYVAFQHLRPHPRTHLLEHDERFAVLAPTEFAPYDLDKPEAIPASLHGTVDLAIADPPFLNEQTNAKLIRTLSLLLHPTRGRLLLLTSTSLTPVLERLYAEPPFGPLRETALRVEHYRGQLQNDFGCWGSWQGAEDVGREELAAEDERSG